MNDVMCFRVNYAILFLYFAVYILIDGILKLDDDDDDDDDDEHLYYCTMDTSLAAIAF